MYLNLAQIYNLNIFMSSYACEAEQKIPLISKGIFCSRKPLGNVVFLGRIKL